MSSRRILIYGDLDVSVIDGSSVWLVSAAEALAAAGFEVTLLLKRPRTEDRLLRPLTVMPNVAIVDPLACQELAVPTLRAGGRAMSLDDAADAIDCLVRTRDIHAVVARGMACVRRLATVPSLRGRLWSYLTDIPQSVALMSENDRVALSEVAKASSAMLCQTEGLRALLEWCVPEAGGKCELWPPIAADPPAAHVVDDECLGHEGRPILLGYIGKFAPMWRTLDMTRLPELLRTRGIHCRVEMFGDKIHRAPESPGWQHAMRDALSSAPGVAWHGGMPRNDALCGVARTHLGLAWRGCALDGSLELSTKLLEYGVLGLPAIANRTRMHEELLGSDYPLFVDEGSDVVHAVERAAADPSIRRIASRRLADMARDYRMERAVPRVRRLVERLLPDPIPEIRSRAKSLSRRLRVVVAGYDMKFMSSITSRWSAMEDLEVRLDLWRDTEAHDVGWSERCLEWADVIVCEWCAGNAVWYSTRRRDDQRLIVRLHRFELDREWPRRMRHGRVDALVCVSPEYAMRTATAFPELAGRIVTVPNFVDIDLFARPKVSGADRTLGMIGISRARKGLGTALDILEEVQSQDPAFRLEIKSELPWRLPWAWRRRDERRYFEAVMGRIAESPRLRESVTFVEPGSDVPSWLRRVGWILSTSDDESFHLSPAEGAASGSVPVVLNWPGSRGVYGDLWTHGSAAEAARWIVERSRDGALASLGEKARRFVAERYSLDRVLSDWSALIAADGSSVGRQS